jgi:hypothetical protein
VPVIDDGLGFRPPAFGSAPPEFIRDAEAQARALGNKALRCLEISQALFPQESDEELESIASDFMFLTDNGINRILRHVRAIGLRSSSLSSPSFSSISLTKEPVPGTGIIEEIKRENRYSILRRENET